MKIQPVGPGFRKPSEERLAARIRITHDMIALSEIKKKYILLIDKYSLRFNEELKKKIEISIFWHICIIPLY